VRLIIRSLAPYWLTAVAAVLLMSGEVIADVNQPALMERIVDVGIRSRDLPYVLSLGSRMVVIALMGLLGGIGCTIFSSYTSQSVGADLRERLFTHVQHLSFRSLDKFQPSTLITRLTNDVTQVQTFVLMMLRMMVRAPLLLVGGTWMIVQMNPSLAPLLLGLYGFMFFGIGVVIWKGLPLFEQVQKKLDSVNRVFRENLSGVRVIKAFVREEYEKNRFDKTNKELMDVTVRVSRLMSVTLPLLFLSMNLCIVLYLWFGAHQVNRGTLEVGKLIAIITYLTQILHSMMMVAVLIVTLARVKASITRIEEIFSLDVENNLSDSVNHPTLSNRKSASLVFQKVVFRYQEGIGDPVLKDVSFQVDAGKTLGILGSTGAGKSTLLSMILRFYHPESGNIFLNGVPLQEYPLGEVREKIGWAMQTPVLFSGTIRENLRWGREDASEEDIRWAARVAQAEEFILKLPEGYDTPIGRRGLTLSGGQKQRLSLSRALVRHPTLLLLDDATSSVDLATEAAIQEELRTLNNTTLIIVAQRISSVVFADTILVLDKGRVVGLGPHTELIRHNRVYKDIYRSQLMEEREDA
jgi:ATP-binding cassette subfamily B protein